MHRGRIAHEPGTPVRPELLGGRSLAVVVSAEGLVPRGSAREWFGYYIAIRQFPAGRGLH
jgi:hypothetical protein